MSLGVISVVCKIVYWLGVLKCVAAADPGPMMHAGLSIIVNLFASRFQLRSGLVDIVSDGDIPLPVRGCSCRIPIFLYLCRNRFPLFLWVYRLGTSYFPSISADPPPEKVRSTFFLALYLLL